MSERFLKGNKERRVLRRIFPSEGLAQRTAAAKRFLGRLRKLEAIPDEVEELLAVTSVKKRLRT